MTSSKHDRRTFLSTAAVGTAGGLLAKTVFPFSVANGATKSATSEYLFTDGITYLNTGTLGPCRRETIEASMKSWEDLESQPVQFYGLLGAKELAEKTRATAAKFLGCDLSEIMITTSTTNGMNAVAQGLRLKAGDRILATDQEHGGGLHCWEYFQKYSGAQIDKVAIPRGEYDTAAILSRIEKAITKQTRVITVSHVFSSTAIRMPIAEISALARSKGIFCIVDGAQAAGRDKGQRQRSRVSCVRDERTQMADGTQRHGLLYISKDAQSAIRPMQFEESYNTYNNTNGVVNLPESSDSRKRSSISNRLVSIRSKNIICRFEIVSTMRCTEYQT
jgi:selenocysteine lyase/cysteine desulfurase